MSLIYHWLFIAVWMAFAAYWLISARWVRKTKRAEPRRQTLLRVALSVAGTWLLFAPNLHLGPLNWRLLPQNHVTFFTGAGILLAGLGFAVWARIHLGQYWSGMITLKEGHRLIRTGPYAVVRHPIYTGIITGIAGTAVAVGELRGFLAVLMYTAIYYWKSRHEERLLTPEFGEEYPAYRQAVGALAPVSGPARTMFWLAAAAVAVLLAIGSCAER